jgi:hypothetical protein
VFLSLVTSRGGFKYSLEENDIILGLEIFTWYFPHTCLAIKNSKEMGRKKNFLKWREQETILTNEQLILIKDLQHMSFYTTMPQSWEDSSSMPKALDLILTTEKNKITVHNK